MGKWAVTPERIVAAARGYLDVPWRNMGRTETGLDCVGLILIVGRDLGRFDYDPGPYGKATTLRQMKEHFARHCDAVPHLDRQAGDFLIFVDPKWSQPHAGILAKDDGGRETMIHSFLKHRAVREDRLTAEWIGRIAAVYRVRGA